MQLRLKDINLVSFLFRAGNLGLIDKVNLSPELRIKIVYDDTIEGDEKNLMVFLSLDIGDIENINEYPFVLSVTYSGFFSFLPTSNPEETAKRLGMINCAAILFPFIREEVASAILKATRHSFLVSPINFYRYFTDKPDRVEFVLKSELERHEGGNA